jgi:tryptophan synthase alpha chain
MVFKIMSHLVAYYPDAEGSMKIARALIKGGAAFLEVQFPFSDPTADGPVIQAACGGALESGFTVDKGFGLVKQIAAESSIPVFIMSYCNLVYTRGIETFLKQTREAGAAGLIVPDLPFDRDEGLYAQAKSLGLEVIPVVAPNTEPERLKKIAGLGTTYLYAALRKGITGAFSAIGEENIDFLRAAKSLGFKVLAGFGISTREQLEILCPEVHAAIIGSAFVREIQAHLKDGSFADAVFKKMRALSGISGESIDREEHLLL